MKKLVLVSILLTTWASGFAQGADVFDEKLTTASNIAATINNFGLIGNSFSGSYNILDYPSCEFPRGSSIEHLFEGGLWVGGILNGEELVSTGAIDAPSGYAPGRAGFEFTSKTPLEEITSLFNRPNFRPDAISHQDFIALFSDTAITTKTSTAEIPIDQHETPLGLEVKFKSFNWQFPFSNFFIVMNYEITNIGNDPIDSVYVGFWLDGVIRNVSITPAGLGGTEFYNKGGNGYIDSLDLCYEFDATGDIGFTDSYVGTKFLGAQLNGMPSMAPSYRVHFNTWQFRNTTELLYFFPDNDRERYQKMTFGLNYLPDWEGTIQDQINAAGNRSNLISAGPFLTMRPGDKIDVAFAIVCAQRVFDGLPAEADTDKQKENLVQNAEWAQTAYDNEFFLPEPPINPRVKVIPSGNKLDVYWSNISEFSVDPISEEKDFEGYRLYKTEVGYELGSTQDIQSALNLIGEFDLAGNGLFFETGLEKIRLEEPVTFPDDTSTYYYKYTFDNVANGWQHAVSVTAFDRGDEVNNVQPLENTPLDYNLVLAYPGRTTNDGFANGDPYVYPNPYYSRADWEGPSNFEEDRKLYFANLPSTCEIRVYTVAGDLVKTIQHDQAYNGSESRWFNTYSDPERTTFSGGEHAWDILSEDNQVLARGLYVFVVIDKESGEKRDGKFVLIR